MDNQNWNLEAFVDSLVVELDKTRETLAVKSINKPLSYTVKDMSLELQIFPTFDGDDVQFRTAQPGQTGASKLLLQLASITDQQVRATSKAPPTKADIKIDQVAIDSKTKQKLRRMGVTSVSDLERIEQREVDIEQATGGAVDYKNLANLIQQARRKGTPPRITKVAMDAAADGQVVRLEGENLSISGAHIPVAVLNDELSEVLDHGPDRIVIQLSPAATFREINDLLLALDPYCIIRLQIKDT